MAAGHRDGSTRGSKEYRQTAKNTGEHGGMRVSISGGGLLDAKTLAHWQKTAQEKTRQAVRSAMAKVGPGMVDLARADLRRGMKLNGGKLPSSIRHKVFDKKKNKLPALYVGSKVDWLGKHETGGTIDGKMLIPLLPAHQRIGKKAFKRVVRDLMAAGNAWFVRSPKGNTVLMSENLAETSRASRHFRRAERSRLGVGKLARSHAIPIAVLVHRVTLKKRFDLAGTVRSQMPRLEREMMKNMNGIFNG